MTAAERRKLAASLRRLLDAIERGEITAPARMVARLEGAARAVDSLGAGRVTPTALRDAAGLLRTMAAAAEAGTLDAAPDMTARLTGGAEVLDTLNRRAR